MNPENKQRIVGIVVLVALIALLIPFLFTSGVKKNTQIATNETTPLQAEGTGINTPGAGEQQPVALPTLPPLPEELAAKTKNYPEELQKQSSSVVQLPTEQVENQGDILPNNDQFLAAGTNTAVAMGTGENAAAIAARNEAEATVIQPTKSGDTSKVVSGKAVKNKLGVAKGKGVFWSVQVGSFTDQARAQKMVATLQAKKCRVYLQKITTTRGPMVRVLIGRETSKDKAMKIAQQLKSKWKIDGRIVRSKK